MAITGGCVERSSKQIRHCGLSSCSVETGDEVEDDDGGGREDREADALLFRALLTVALY